MTAAARPARYGAVAMTLHWLIAAAIIANIILAVSADDLPRLEKMELMGWHKSIGLTVLVLSLVRLGWRLMNPAPAAAPGPALARAAASGLHLLFYVLIIAIPLGGWMMVSTHGNPVPFYGLFAWPAFPGVAGMDHEVFETGHVVAAWALAALVPVHIAAALYHHLIVKDDVLLRMLPGTKRRGGA